MAVLTVANGGDQVAKHLQSMDCESLASFFWWNDFKKMSKGRGKKDNKQDSCGEFWQITETYVHREFAKAMAWSLYT